MEFGLSEEQRLLQESLDKALSSFSEEASLRLMYEEGKEAQALEKQIADLGVGGVLIGEEHGGMGLCLLDAVLVQEVLGRHVAPSSFLSRGILAPVAFREGASPGQQKEWLEKMAADSVRFATGLGDAGVEEKGGALHGRTLFARDVKGATHIVGLEKTGRLFFAPLSEGGVETRTLKTIDKGLDVHEIVFSGARCEILSGGNRPERAGGRVLAAGRLALAGDILGAGERMLEKAVSYAKEREQFGQVIGSFQAVKHLCAEMAAVLEPARSLVWYGSHAFDALPEEAEQTACLAKARLGEVGRFVARTSTEVHGGSGFADLSGLHFWFKRIGASREMLGGPEYLYEEACRLQGWGG